jgi:DNA-3-methyladenine glycosylase I
LISEQGSLAEFFWQFEPSKQLTVKSKDDIPAKTDESTAMSKELKRRGWSFVGPTTCYAFMQSMGIVNDHVKGCRFHAPTKLARKNFQP